MFIAATGKDIIFNTNNFTNNTTNVSVNKYVHMYTSILKSASILLIIYPLQDRDLGFGASCMGKLRSIVWRPQEVIPIHKKKFIGRF